LLNIQIRRVLFVTAILYGVVLVLPAKAALLGDETDGSRAIPGHVTELIDEEGQRIYPDDEPLLPFSTRRTCGTCHSYDKISKGWHFSAADTNVPAGRVGQPWILVDAGTCTQIPLSYRHWPGTFRPEQLGLTARQFTQIFGGHMPGGGCGELDSDNPNEQMRSLISGKLEINCLSCHNAEPGQDQAEYAEQIAQQNFRWAATAACEFASVTGSAKQMPNTYDPLMPDMLDNRQLVPPTVTYRKNTFDQKNMVSFNITREVANERCYFCHSNKDVGKTAAQKWATDEDVHLAAGLSCIDCHRNGLDHNITRGYEGEDLVSTNPLAAVSSCKGCHEQGRLGAPVLKHAGIPAAHFDKLTCTVCHSGPWPEKKSRRIKTSRAHALGTHNVNKADEALPHIIYPVFAKQRSIGAAYMGGILVLRSDGKIAPHKLLWPAFWGTLKNGKVIPIELEIVRQTVGKILAKEKLPRSGDWPKLTGEQIAAALELLSSQKSVKGKAVYICGSKLYQLNDEDKLIAGEHEAAKAYLWPMAHNVRPAAQSLGVHQCQDCHSADGPFFFGKVAVDSALAEQMDSSKKMVEFMDVPAFYTKAFAVSFVFRPWLKVVTLGSCAVLAAVLLLYALKALRCIAKVLAGRQ